MSWKRAAVKSVGCVSHFPESKIMYIRNGKIEKFDRSILLNANWHFLELFGQNAQSRSKASCILL